MFKVLAATPGQLCRHFCGCVQPFRIVMPVWCPAPAAISVQAWLVLHKLCDAAECAVPSCCPADLRTACMQQHPRQPALRCWQQGIPFQGHAFTERCTFLCVFPCLVQVPLITIYVQCSGTHRWLTSCKRNHQLVRVLLLLLLPVALNEQCSTQSSHVA